MNGGKRILIVDDDASLRDMLCEQLSQAEFSVIAAENGEQALEKAQDGLFDVILLDIGLPDQDGREVCRLLRQQGVKCPIIMVTAADSESDTVLGLDSGANDYIAKPFRLSVMLARLRAHIRQHERSDDAQFGIGPYMFQPSAKLLVNPRTKRKIHLTDKEASILKYLYRAGDKVISRESLLEDVWGYNLNVTTHTLETHIYRLRQKIEDNPAQAIILVTEVGGYRLVR